MTHGEDRSSRDTGMMKEEALERIEFQVSDPWSGISRACGCSFCRREDGKAAALVSVFREEDIRGHFVVLCGDCLLRSPRELADVAKGFRKYGVPSEASFFFPPLFEAIDSLAEIKGFSEACRFLCL